MLSRCTAYVAPPRQDEGLRRLAPDDQLRLDRLFHRSVAHSGPASLLRPPARSAPDVLSDQQRRIGGHRMGGGERRLQRCRVLFVLRCRRRPVHPDPVRARGRRHLRTARRAPHRDSDVRTHGHDGSAEAHRCPVTAFSVAHTETTEGERGLHVAARRPSHRRVHRRWQMRVSRCLRETVLPDRRRRSARRPGGGPRRVPRSVRGDPTGHQHRSARPRADRNQPAGVGRREVRPLHRGPPEESRATTY